MPHIFVSHATADDTIVNRLCEALKTATGQKFWMDHQDIHPADNWQTTIETGLRDCDSLLLAVSRTSVTRDEVTAEWRDALMRGLTVYIAIIDDIPVVDIPARLRLIQWVDLHADWDGGIAALTAVIRGEDLHADAPVTIVHPVTGKIDRRLTTIPISGRDADLAEIQRLLKHGPTAILGVGGFGKSRLAAEIVVKGDGIGGAIWHTVSDISRAEEVLELLRDHFKLDATVSRKDTLAKLNPNKRLIVLDNAEDVKPDDARRADYVALVDDLVNAGALLLLTSRVEWDDIQLCQPYTPQTLSHEAARQIVLDMAAAFTVPHDLTTQADSIATAARLHPRLIEWAVRQMKKFPPDKVIRDLKELKSGKIQEALDEMILKTLRQMTEAEGAEAETALKRLTVCRDGFTYDAATYICAAMGGDIPDIEEAQAKWFEEYTNILDDSLSTLQTWQFVTINSSRYQVDPLVIAAVGEDETAHRPHYDYYKALAQQHDKKQDYLGLDPESANLEAAFEWAMSTGDYEAAYWLAGSALMNFLANRGRFVQSKTWLERVASELENHPDDSLRASVQNSLGVLYQNHPSGNRRDNQKRAVAAFEAALMYYKPEAVPLDYATTQNNLGTAYGELAQIEEQEANLKRALAAFETALVYRTAEAAPLNYAMTKNNLGAAYRNLAEIEEREENLKRAIAAYEAALVYYTPEVVPLDYAKTQMNLGSAYLTLAEIEEREENLKRAIAAYEAALVYRTAEAAPLGYARTLYGLGAAYQNLSGLEEQVENLKRAVDSYQTALVYLMPETAPLDYAMTQHNLGLVRQDQGELEAALACWREAEHYFQLIGQENYADLARDLIEYYGGGE